MTHAKASRRMKEITYRLNEIWFDGEGPAGGEIDPKCRKEFKDLLDEQDRLFKELAQDSDQ